MRPRLWVGVPVRWAGFTQRKVLFTAPDHAQDPGQTSHKKHVVDDHKEDWARECNDSANFPLPASGKAIWTMCFSDGELLLWSSHTKDITLLLMVPVDQYCCRHPFWIKEYNGSGCEEQRKALWFCSFILSNCLLRFCPFMHSTRVHGMLACAGPFLCASDTTVNKTNSLSSQTLNSVGGK